MLKYFVDWLIYDLLNLAKDNKLGTMLNFFIYDSLKILFLIFIMVAFVGYFRTYVSEEKVKIWLMKKNKLVSHIIASSFGALTPFCSCSSIPLFFSFLKAGIPLGITFSFLITSPLINEYLVVLMVGFFGWKITFLYVLSGILLGVSLGYVLGKLNLNKYLVKDIIACSGHKHKKANNFLERFYFGLNEGKDIVKKTGIWILLGVSIGALIHNYIPQEFISSLISKGGIFTIPIATILGVPIYGSCAAIVPIAVALFDKGIPLGTALAFMMSTSALSLPSAIILKRAMKNKLLLIFFFIVTLGIIITGYLFNLLQLIIL